MIGEDVEGMKWRWGWLEVALLKAVMVICV